MANDLWRNLNRMPAAFRKRTTDEFQMQYKKMNATTQKERNNTHRSIKEAMELANNSTDYKFLRSKKAELFTFCTINGDNYMDNIVAGQVFINICRNLDHSYASQIITIWDTDHWCQLNVFVAKQSEQPANA